MSSDASHLETIFFAALEIQDPEARADFLATACDQNDELRQRVLQMLAVQSQVGNFMEHPPAPYAGTVQFDKEILAAGLSAGFGPGEAVVIGSANHSVLKSLGHTLSEVPRVLLRDAKESGEDPIVRPRSKEIPADHADSRYQLAGEIARGGMGAIIKGRDIDLGRDLAIKVLLDAHKDKPEVVQRFIEEAQIGGQLQHPGIVPVYELGQFGDQRPFFSMKLVKGETLAGLLSARKNPTEDRAKYLGIYEQVCQTMAYAHSRGVIHRDLKPANIMVGAFGEVQVMDWGLAKVLAAGGIADEKKSLAKQADVSVIQTRRSLGSDSPGTLGSLGSQTQMGSVMGTPAYMSPEQALGEVDRLDERTDVFGLGAILCEILTGKPPYVAASGEQVFRLASRGKLDDCYARLDASVVDAELRQIVRDALALEPDGRLRDAGVLAGRISRYLESVESRLRQAEVDRATETARTEEALKTAAQESVARKEAQGRVIEELRRRRVTMALTASLLIGVIGIGGFALHARDQQQRAEVARQNALLAQQAAETSQQSEILQRAAADAARVSEAAQRAVAEDQRDKATALSDALAFEKQELSRRKEEQRRMLYISDMNRIQAVWDADNVSRVLELLNAHRPQPGEVDLRGFEWHYWNRQCHSDLRTVKLNSTMSVKSPAPLVFSPDGKRLFGMSFSQTQDVKVLDTQSGVERIAFNLLVKRTFSVVSCAWHPDGTRVAMTNEDRNGTMELIMWDMHAEKPLFTIIEPSSVERLLENLTGKSDLWFSGDGTRFAATVGRRDGDGPVQPVVKFWNSGTGEELATVPLPSQRVSSVTISADGSRIAFASHSAATEEVASGEAIKILEVASPDKVATIPLSGPASFRLSPNGQRLFVSGTANSSRSDVQESGGGVFDTSTGQRLFLLPDPEPWFIARISPDGQWLAVNSQSRPRSVKLYRTTGDRAPVEFQGHTDRLSALSFSPDSQRLFTVAGDSRIKTWDVAALRSEPVQLASAGILSRLLTVVSSDGKQIATAPNAPLTANASAPDTRKNVITVRDEAGNVLHQTAELVGPIKWLKFSPDGRRLAACAVAEDGDLLTAAQLCVWDTASWAEQLTLRLPAFEDRYSSSSASTQLVIRRNVSTAAFSPDGRRLAAIDVRGSGTASTSAVKTWEIDTRREVWESEKGSFLPTDLKFSPDGRRIVAAPDHSSDRLTVWDALDGRMLWKTRTNSQVTAVGFSSDGQLIFGWVEQLGAIQLWDAASGRELQTILDPIEGFGSPRNKIVVLSPNGQWLAAGHAFHSSTIKVWDVNRPERELYALAGHGAPILGIAFSPDSRRIATCTRLGYLTGEAGGETKLWDTETGQELLTLPGAARNIVFSANGTGLIAESGDTLSGDIRVQRWDASRLLPQVEAEQMVEAFTARHGENSLPLASEILARIEADTLLPDETRAAAIAIVKGLRREKDLNQAAWEIALLPGQPPQKYHRALQYLEEVGGIDPNNRESWSTRGLAHYRLGQSTEALSVLTRSQELHAAKKLALPAEDLTILAMTQHQLGKRDEARTTLEQVRASASRNETQWRKLLAEAETLLGIPQAADHPELWVGRKFMPRKDAAVENEHGQRARPRNPYLITHVVGDRLKMGTYSVARSQVVSVEEASHYYSHWIEADPENSEAYNLRGHVSRFMGDFDQAIADHSAAIGQDSHVAGYFNDRGLVWHKDKHDLDKALADFDTANRISPSAWNHATRGNLLRERGELDDALTSFDEAIHLAPAAGWFYAWRAALWSAKGDRSKMQQDLDDAIHHSPDDVQTLNARAWLMATSPVAEHRNGKQAVDDATKACELTVGRDTDCLTTLAAAFAETGDFEQAVNWQRQVLTMLPLAARAEDEARLKLYRERQPFRDIPKNPPAANAISAPPTEQNSH